MIGDHFYHGIIRKVIIAFGTMFNNIQIVREDSSGNVVQSMKVPLAYGPKQKALTLLAQNPNQTKSTAISLPRIGFEKRSISYDPERKQNRMHKLKVANGADKAKTQYMPVPYNLTFELFIMAKNSEDALEIVEQILPYFQPEYTVTINDNNEMDGTRDIPIVLDDISYEDTYEGDFVTRRAIMWTLTFTAKFFLYGPVTDEKIVKQVQVDQYTDMPVNSPAREHRYTVAPDPQSTPIGTSEDDFGFNETVSFFQDAKTYNPETGEDE